MGKARCLLKWLHVNPSTCTSIVCFWIRGSSRVRLPFIIFNIWLKKYRVGRISNKINRYRYRYYFLDWVSNLSFTEDFILKHGLIGTDYSVRYFFDNTEGTADSNFRHLLETAGRRISKLESGLDIATRSDEIPRYFVLHDGETPSSYSYITSYGKEWELDLYYQGKDGEKYRLISKDVQSPVELYVECQPATEQQIDHFLKYSDNET